MAIYLFECWISLTMKTNIKHNFCLTADLLKLVHPEDPAGVSAMGAHFLSEAGGEAGVADGQVFRFEPLVPQEGCDGLLRGGDQVLLVDGVVVWILTALADDLMETQTEGWAMDRDPFTGFYEKHEKKNHWIWKLLYPDQGIWMEIVQKIFCGTMSIIFNHDLCNFF